MGAGGPPVNAVQEGIRRGAHFSFLTGLFFGVREKQFPSAVSPKGVQAKQGLIDFPAPKLAREKKEKIEKEANYFKEHPDRMTYAGAEKREVASKWWTENRKESLS